MKPRNRSSIEALQARSMKLWNAQLHGFHFSKNWCLVGNVASSSLPSSSCVPCSKMDQDHIQSALDGDCSATISYWKPIRRIKLRSSSEDRSSQFWVDWTSDGSKEDFLVVHRCAMHEHSDSEGLYSISIYWKIGFDFFKSTINNSLEVLSIAFWSNVSIFKIKRLNKGLYMNLQNTLMCLISNVYVCFERSCVDFCTLYFDRHVYLRLQFKLKILNQ